ncbi:MAG: histidinol-phosphatase [Erysipelotrichaceae bacterium]
MDYNYHTHTIRCGHAKGSDEQYILSAIEAGLKVLGFSDHIPYPLVSHPSDRMDYNRMDEYIKSIRLLQVKYQDQIEIKLGFEMEYFIEFKDYYTQVRSQVDYLICGQHSKFCDSYEYSAYCNDDDLEVYASQVVSAIESGLVSFIAHPDYFMLGRKVWNDSCDRAAHKIAHAAQTHHIPLEINLNGLRFGPKKTNVGLLYPYPCGPFWKIISEYHVDCILSFDAHYPQILLDKERIETVKEILVGLNLNILDHYRL